MAHFVCVMKQMPHVDRPATPPDDEGEAQIERKRRNEDFDIRTRKVGNDRPFV